jgi:hypothetical protein
MWNGSTCFPKNHLQILDASKVTRNKLHTYGLVILEWPVNLTYPTFSERCMWTEIHFYKQGRERNRNNYAANFRHRRTKFSHPADRASGICAPLVHGHSRDSNFGHVHRLRLQENPQRFECCICFSLQVERRNGRGYCGGHVNCAADSASETLWAS